MKIISDDFFSLFCFFHSFLILWFSRLFLLIILFIYIYFCMPNFCSVCIDIFTYSSYFFVSPSSEKNYKKSNICDEHFVCCFKATGSADISAALFEWNAKMMLHKKHNYLFPVGCPFYRILKLFFGKILEQCNDIWKHYVKLRVNVGSVSTTQFASKICTC